MAIKEHCCEEYLEERMATAEESYNYVGSGLTNVFLVGVKYYGCRICGMQSAEIPSLKALLSAIAREIVQKPSPLSGLEVRFLRKRLSRKAKDFASIISLSPERLSAIESAEEPNMDPARDKLIRVVYGVLSGDKKLRTTLEEGDRFERWITAIQGKGHGEQIRASWLSNRKWRVETSALAA